MCTYYGAISYQAGSTWEEDSLHGFDPESIPYKSAVKSHCQWLMEE